MNGDPKEILAKSFEYKAKIIGKTPANNDELNTEFVILLKYLSNLWRFLDLSLISYEIELDFAWSEDCGISTLLNNNEVTANPTANPFIFQKDLQLKQHLN